MKRLMQLGLLALCSAGLTAADTGVINADRLNVRLEPALNAAVATKLEKGAVVEILGKKGEFLEIAAPANTPVYLSAVYVSNGKLTRNLNMRSDMSTDAASYGLLPAGTEVKVLEESPYGWLKIAPPAGLKLYVAQFYVTVTPTAKPVEAAKPVETKPVETKPIETAKPADTKPADTKPAETKPAETKPVEAAKPAEAKPVVKELPAGDLFRNSLTALGIDLAAAKPYRQDGYLVAIPNPTTPLLRYALMVVDGNGTQLTGGYVAVEETIDLAEFVGQPVVLEGKLCTVPKWKNPVIKAERVSLIKPESISVTK